MEIVEIVAKIIMDSKSDNLQQQKLNLFWNLAINDLNSQLYVQFWKFVEMFAKIILDLSRETKPTRIENCLSRTPPPHHRTLTQRDERR